MSLVDMLLEQGGPSAKLAMMGQLSGIDGGIQGPYNSSVSPSGKPADWISQAMNITNTPQKWADELYDLMMRESHGDPNAYNKTPVDSGEHAQGLFQTIPSTFQAHNLPRLGGINDPVSNAVAAIRYIQGRYGNPGNLPSSGGY